jgi:DNA (cytosine-5)-methyltransferase 1
LRTPNGGSSRQTVILVNDGQIRSRLMTVRECARLMGAPDTYELPGSYNDGYRAMGDAVAVPVTRWITRHLLAPLAARSRSSHAKATSQSAA